MLVNSSHKAISDSVVQLSRFDGFRFHPESALVNGAGFDTTGLMNQAGGSLQHHVKRLTFKAEH